MWGQRWGCVMHSLPWMGTHDPLSPSVGPNCGWSPGMASLARSRAVLRYAGLPPSLPFRTANLDPMGGGGELANLLLFTFLCTLCGAVGP
jgi:hypothetical protein